MPRRSPSPIRSRAQRSGSGSGKEDQRSERAFEPARRREDAELDPTCWLCGRNGSADPLDRHHIFGGPYRKSSERYGLVVYLCHQSCHIFGPQAVHSCPETMRSLRAWGQRKAMREQGWSLKDFIRVFGKNYLP